MTKDDHKEILDKFKHHVNMDKKELKEWLDSETSMNTGQEDSDGEPKGHKSGKQIMEILGKKDYDDEDYAHMKRVNAYCGRHLKQGPGKEVENSKWRYSLMNWGCDPLKKPIGDRDSVVQPGKASSNGKDSKAESPKKGAKASSPANSPAKGKADDKKDDKDAKSPAKGKADDKKDEKKEEDVGDKRKPEKAADKAESPKKAKK